MNINTTKNINEDISLRVKSEAMAPIIAYMIKQGIIHIGLTCDVDDNKLRISNNIVVNGTSVFSQHQFIYNFVTKEQHERDLYDLHQRICHLEHLIQNF